MSSQSGTKTVMNGSASKSTKIIDNIMNLVNIDDNATNIQSKSSQKSNLKPKNEETKEIITNNNNNDSEFNPDSKVDPNDFLARAQANVLVVCEELPKNTPTVKGVDFNKGNDIDNILNAFITTGFQATNLANGISEINKMINWRMPKNEYNLDSYSHLTMEQKKDARCTIFLGMTSNMCSSGTREVIKYLCQHNMVDCIVTTCGAIEEDIMKCFNPHYIGSFYLKGKDLRLKGQNRIGNLIVPNKNYCAFEDWLTPILVKMLDEQKTQNIIWTPSKLIRRIGKEINNENSVWYWCYKNNIPVFCPAITDGAVGDILYFMSYKHEGFILDISRDIRLINDIALSSIKSGMIILGGGVIKHHICNANLMRNGADYSVFINTANEYDGSDAGARPDEAVSWGKIKLNAKPVKIYGDATVLFPFVVAGTFAHKKNKHNAKKPKRKIDDCYLIDPLL